MAAANARLANLDKYAAAVAALNVSVAGGMACWTAACTPPPPPRPPPPPCTALRYQPDGYTPPLDTALSPLRSSKVGSDRAATPDSLPCTPPFLHSLQSLEAMAALCLLGRANTPPSSPSPCAALRHQLDGPDPQSGGNGCNRAERSMADQRNGSGEPPS